MSTWSSLALSYAGFAFLAMAMKRYSLDMLGHVLTSRMRRATQVTGAVLVAVSLRLCVHRWGASVGVCIWLGLLTASSLGLGLQLTYKPRQVAPFALVLAPLGLATNALL